MAELLVVVPSRERPGNITRLVEAMATTCRADTDLIVGVDMDDPLLRGYLTEMDWEWDGTGTHLDTVIQAEGQWPYKVEARSGMRTVVPWVNYLAMEHHDRYRAVGHFGDDNMPHTVGWDVEMLMALEETPFAFANDLYPRTPGSLCCHVFMRSEVVERLRYFGPPVIKHMYVDVAWMAWGVKTGITYRHDVILEHLHYTKGQAAYDPSYQRSTSLIPVDLLNWHTYCATDLNRDIAKIQPGNPGFTEAELKKFNIDLNIPPCWGAPVVW